MINAKLTIILPDQEMELSMEDAQELFRQLQKVFKEEQVNLPMPYGQQPTIPWYPPYITWCGSDNHPHEVNIKTV